MSIYKGTQLISGVATPVQGARNIGQIIQSTIPLTDAGLHLLDGALIDGNGIYSAFVDYIASIYDASASYFTTEASWQDSVTNYGVCGKFVYDSVNNTVRLPKVTGFVEGASGVTNLGDLTQAGLPDVMCPMYAEDGIVNNHMASGGTTLEDVHWSLSTFNSIYGNSNTVQPQSIKVLYYIVVATSTKTDIEVDIDEIVTDLNGKADVDLSNTNNQAKILMSGMGMPSNTYIDLTLGASGATYTAPANGWFVLEKTAWDSGTSQVNPKYIKMINNSNRFTDYDSANWQFECCCSCPVKKGDIISINYDCVGTTNLFRFFYAQGSESEA